jgi:hypothetical protein
MNTNIHKNTTRYLGVWGCETGYWKGHVGREYGTGGTLENTLQMCGWVSLCVGCRTGGQQVHGGVQVPQPSKITVPLVLALKRWQQLRLRRALHASRRTLHQLRVDRQQGSYALVRRP